MTHSGKISWLLEVAFKNYDHFGIALWSKIRIVWSKALKIEYDIKSRAWIYLSSNFATILILIIEKSKKKGNFKNSKF